MRIYLDNCCYNRPYDDQSYLMVALEAKSKIYIQELIKNKKYDLVTSYILRYECSLNPFEMRKEAIMQYIEDNTSAYVGIERKEEIENKAKEIMETGIHFKDACHVASAIYAGCEYFISTDKRLLKYETDEIKMVTPIDFISETESD
ncbi:MAG: hypothetical protein J6P57_05045 [Lachnospiraceae bacterium]|nr:hypothetical protein [Lachnospiraceae bacterium]